jgi:hypothetical protein
LRAAGPGSGLFEEPAAGVRRVRLDCRVVPECPPGGPSRLPWRRRPSAGRRRRTTDA